MDEKILESIIEKEHSTPLDTPSDSEDGSLPNSRRTSANCEESPAQISRRNSETSNRGSHYNTAITRRTSVNRADVCPQITRRSSERSNYLGKKNRPTSALSVDYPPSIARTCSAMTAGNGSEDNRPRNPVVVTEKWLLESVQNYKVCSFYKFRLEAAYNFSVFPGNFIKTSDIVNESDDINSNIAAGSSEVFVHENQNKPDSLSFGKNNSIGSKKSITNHNDSMILDKNYRLSSTVKRKSKL